MPTSINYFNAFIGKFSQSTNSYECHVTPMSISFHVVYFSHFFSTYIEFSIEESLIPEKTYFSGIVYWTKTPTLYSSPHVLA